jgi:hypothetical protein
MALPSSRDEPPDESKPREGLIGLIFEMTGDRDRTDNFNRIVRNLAVAVTLIVSIAAFAIVLAAKGLSALTLHTFYFCGPVAGCSLTYLTVVTRRFRRRDRGSSGRDDRLHRSHRQRRP